MPLAHLYVLFAKESFGMKIFKKQPETIHKLNGKYNGTYYIICTLKSTSNPWTVTKAVRIKGQLYWSFFSCWLEIGHGKPIALP